MDAVQVSVTAGRSALERGDLQNAWAHAEKARQEAVFDPRPLCLMAEILIAAGQFGHARSALAEVASLSPRSTIALMLRAEIDLKEGQFEQARDRFAALTDQSGLEIRALRGLTMAYFGLGDVETSAELAAGAVSRSPADAEMLRLLVLSLKACGRSAEAIDALKAFQRQSAEPDSLEWLGVMPRLYAPTPPDEVFDSHLRFARYGSRGIARVRDVFPDTRDPLRPLHIGYFQPEYWGRWMPRFIHPWLLEHDQSQFRITLYASGDPAQDERSTAAFKGMGYRNLWASNDEAMARTIADDSVDILVDLAGLTHTGRPGMLARKPAPILVTWLGYPATTGLDAVDYRIVDAVTDPPGSERFATEQLWRLDPCFLGFRFPDGLPDPAPPPAPAAGHVTFGSFNAVDKIGPHVIAAWAAIMAATDGSRFIVKNSAMARPKARAALAEQFAKHGINPARILALPETATEAEHYEMYARVDVALDTFPYNGTTTTADALWMGVPLVSVVGDSHVSRVGASILGAAGLADLAAPTLDGYIRLAAELARDTRRCESLRRSIRAKVAASPLCDARGFAWKLEGAYRTMWRRYCGVQE